MLSFIFYCFLIYLLYNIVFKFVLPVYRTTKQVKQSFRNMREQMQQHTAPEASEPLSAKKPQQKAPAAEYIEFEEVKE